MTMCDFKIGRGTKISKCEIFNLEEERYETTQT